jgi:hypothetical protein
MSPVKELKWNNGMLASLVVKTKMLSTLGVPKEPHRMGRQIVAFVTSYKFADSDAGLIGGNGVQKHQPVGMNAGPLSLWCFD